jgi:hypothetical protein
MYIAPASLNIGTRVRVVKYFCLSKVYSIGIDGTIRNVQVIGAMNANWRLVSVFVVRTDIVLEARFIPQPTSSIGWG